MENRGVNEETRYQRHESRTNTTFMEFIRDLCEQGGWSADDGVRYAATVLTRLEQRLTGEEAKDLNAQLPLKLVEILNEARRPPTGEPVEKFHRDDFIGAIGSDLGCSHDEAESIIRGVFMTVRSRISEGEASDVESQLPKDMKPLWARPI